MIPPFFGERHPSVPMCMGFVKGSLDEKLPSYEVFKMRENRCVENRCPERIDAKRIDAQRIDAHRE